MATSATGGAGASPAVDEDLYSRQLFTLGHKAQARMSESNVLVVGMQGIGVEVAKNVILMGVKSVSLFDPNPTQPADLSTQFYLSEADIGKPRAAQSVAKLMALNQYVRVEVLAESSITEEVVSRFDVIVSTDQPIAESLRLSTIARAKGKKFVLAEARGVFGRIFCDFGDKFVVDDTTGENPVSMLIEGITCDKAGVVRTPEGMRHGLSDGDHVRFTEVQGMVEVNEDRHPAPFPIKVLDPFTFSIGDTSAFTPYVRNGWAHQVKLPAEVSFSPLSSMLGAVGGDKGPSHEALIVSDFSKFDRPPVLHAAFGALHAHMAANGGKAPLPNDEAAVAAIVAATQATLGSDEGSKMSDGNAAAATFLARTAGGQVGPVCAVMGGIGAQEVLKAVSGKFSPLRQWLYFDAVEALPFAHDAPLPAAETAPTGTRYDGQVAVFGRSFQERVGALHFFLVGAGAIGCEMLKSWACMGVGCGPSGKVTVTDMDRIEKSNLSRQFLFRAGDIGKAKSTTAVAAAIAMNPAMRAEAQEQRVCPETENIYNDDFWTQLSGVCTALDNVDARRYVDSRCVYYGKPMLDSGTLGAKGSTQVVVPHMTENYGASNDPPEQGIPVCILKAFPFKIEHTLQWAREWFEGEFKQLPEAAQQYIAGGASYLEALSMRTDRLETLEKIQAVLVASKASSVEQCVTWARFKFDEIFNHAIKQLLHNFPPDAKDKSGEPFWSGHKRQPSPIDFSAEDPVHMAFVASVTRLRAAMYGIPVSADYSAEKLKTMAAAVVVPKFEPRSGVFIAADEKEAKEHEEKQKKAATEGGAAAGGGAAGGAGADTAAAGWDVNARAAAIEAGLPAPAALSSFALSAQDFEKDDDLHCTFVAACGNLRARNYNIGEVDKHNAKGIAGKIIPAIATTTALVTGLISLELYKVVAAKPMEAYRSSFVNLALPLFAMSEPVPKKAKKYIFPPAATWVPPGIDAAAIGPAKDLPAGHREWKWSSWDVIDIEGPKTLLEFLRFLRDGLGLAPSAVAYAGALLFQKEMPNAKKNERMPLHVGKLAHIVSKREFGAHVRYISLDVDGTGTTGTGAQGVVELPSFRYKLSDAELAYLAEHAAPKA